MPEELTSQKVSTSRSKRVLRTFTRPPTTGGAAVALLFWWLSLYPSLLPRAWVIQAAVSAICASVGYAVGTLLGRIVRAALRRSEQRIAGARFRQARLGLACGALLVLVFGSWLWLGWQNDQRDLFDMDHIAVASVVPMLLATIVLIAILTTLGRLVGATVRALDRWNRRHLPRSVAQPLTVVLVAVVGVLLLRDVAFPRFTSWADTSFGVFDTGTREGLSPPQTGAASGGPGSLVDWDDLGYQGRNFVAGSTSTEDLHEFWGDDDGAADVEIAEPIRAYAGLRSADTAQERAELAVDDLERAGGFEREVLVVATSTGTGWIDPDAAEAIEQMYRGDTAIVSMQYSFLPSWISFITDLDKATEAGAKLYNEVHERWSALPEDDRPQLLVFGLSLGSFGAEGAFAGADAQTSLTTLALRSEGVLLVGAPSSNPIHRQLTDGRDPGSSSWAPVFDGGRIVRFTTRDPNQPDISSDWDAPRVLYVQHPTDPVTHWSVDWLWSRPDWMDSPRGQGVTGDGLWFPFVTWTQGIFDLMAGFSAPPGFGHDYRLDYVDAWSRVAPPDGWTDDDTARLEQFLHATAE